MVVKHLCSTNSAAIFRINCSRVMLNETRILLLSWFDSNVCTILRHLSLIAWFICELIHFIMSWTFLKGLLSCYTKMGIWYSCMNRHLFLKWGTKQLFKEWPIFCTCYKWASTSPIAKKCLTYNCYCYRNRLSFA